MRVMICPIVSFQKLFGHNMKINNCHIFLLLIYYTIPLHRSKQKICFSEGTNGHLSH
uniref:Uncharacterized protein n=1 Tax=Rhizophora mucronata TaxID=61149 RepID=A0A2P2K8E8_RHIMU